ncbi:MAG: 2-C-methyl-D-erythritol 2,4-cyclodiphosphate synthase [Planctomycetaceae bacterium]|nr:2-C-methyl-D-erythritol 2,4-cyclodiphosphate synthase [Planctomycetaceae bacterium]
MTTLRVGQGFDIHRLVEGRPCVIGGVTIPFNKGCDGHSDADPLLHAIVDALLGAAGMGDIGEHFPDTDPRYKNADSRELVRHTVKLLSNARWTVVNIDATVMAEAPKLSPHKKAMQESIAKCAGIPVRCVNVKAKTMEGMDAVGRGDAIAVHCCILIEGTSGALSVSS